MTIISSIEELESHYGSPGEASLIKVSDRLNSQYRRFVEASPFMILATCGPEGLDCSPRGDAGQVVRIADDKTLLIPDRRGNNRIDSLRNIVRDNRVALIFLVPGSDTTIRVNGAAEISVDEDLKQSLAVEGKLPRSVVVVRIGEIYFQCARALMRANIWGADARVDPASLPSAGELLKAMKESFDDATYDADWSERAQKSLW